MGGVCSSRNSGRKVDYYSANRTVYQSNEFRKQRLSTDIKVEIQSDSAYSPARDSMEERQPQDWRLLKESTSYREMGARSGYASSEDDFYDGIPRFPRALSLKSRSFRSRQAAKVSEVSSRLAGSLGLGKAVEVLDTLGSSMTGLNQSSGFVSNATTKGNELQILAFEVANTIVKGSSLLQSLSKRSMRQLKEVVLASEGVQQLVSKDMNELLTIIASDKRTELRIFATEVVRFGNRCKDSQWHNLDRYFEKRATEVAPPKQLQEEAEQMMVQLMTLVQYTAELYHVFEVLDLLNHEYLNKRLVEYNSYASQRGDKLAGLRAELKNQKKLAKNLKKKSLWSRSLEEVMEKLVDIVLFLNREIHNVFGNADADKPSEGSPGKQKRLGPAGLDLHYANIVIQIDTIVARCNSIPSILRDTLYQSLPPSMRSSLRSKLQSFHVKEGMTLSEIKDEMEKTLHWLVPIAINTAKDHHGFGWVGEWGNTGPEVNRKPAGPMDVIRIETLHYADKEKTEACIVELLLWLNHLVYQSKAAANCGKPRPQNRSPARAKLQKTNQQSVELANSAPSPTRSTEDQDMPRDTSNNGENQE
ncbi:protein PSK SIMULATOR 1-like [Diospyros lotus]|uniref:protein PSK SIMULATOR 1-like n=1 Tax=Diospyros lotus TaxID=55363 RepID=UPI002259D9F4|nr:protein PSK SIMULATOR 1-like [Diospyros lotus]XP_052199163.1 protein PSK SIMULATOR 1-like [Diospyros lotus]XP_052199164.1 protein PSK SIMULATOR 1-like [Diospyros lotus]